LLSAVGEGLGGDLEAVEEDSGAMDVEFVGGEAGDDFREGALDVLAGVGSGEGEALAGAAVGGGFAGGVMVVAEALAAEGRGAAGAGVLRRGWGEGVVAGDVEAEFGHCVILSVAFRQGGWGKPPRYFWSESLVGKGLGGRLV
jgi:hypothetical protein